MSFPFYKYFQIIPERELYNLAIHPQNGISKYRGVQKKNLILFFREFVRSKFFQKKIIINIK